MADRFLVLGTKAVALNSGRRISIVVVCLAILLTLGVSSADAAVTLSGTSYEMEGNFIKTGVSNNGTLGVGHTTSPGFLFDPAGTGTFGDKDDYLTPGSPAEGFSVSYTGSGGEIVNNNDSQTCNIGSAATPTDVSGSSSYDNAVQWQTTMGGVMNVTHLYEFDNDQKNVAITTTIEALTDLTDLKFARWIDPDSGGTSSINNRGNASLGLAANDWINSVSESNGATLGLYSESTVTHNSGMTYSWDQDPACYTTGGYNSDGTTTQTVGDHMIGLGFDVGALSNGSSVVLEYAYVVSANANDLDVGVGKWIGTTDNDWTTTTNWDPEKAPTDGGAVLIEAAGTQTINHNVSGNTYNNWTYNSGGAATTIGGNNVSIADSGAITNNSSNLQTFSVDVLAAGDLTIDGGSAGISLQNVQVADGSTLTYDTGTANNNNVTGVISGSGSDLVVDGSGTLTLSGANTYSGGTTVSGGTLVGNTISLQGDIVNNATLEFKQTVDGNYAGDLSGSGSITKSGDGTLTLSGANTCTGGIVILGGQVIGSSSNIQSDISSSGTVRFNETTGGTFNGSITGAGGMVKSGTGTLSVGGNIECSGTGVVVTGGGLNVLGGTVTGTTTVQSGGSLGGTGTFNDGIVVENGGAHAPGNSIGAVITGDYTHDTGSFLEIEVNEHGQCDTITASGDVTINGGTVQVKLDTGADASKILVGTEFTFLTSQNNSITGAGFEGIEQIGFNFPITVLRRQASTYSIMCLGFNYISQTPNQASVGTYLDELGMGGGQSSDFYTVVGAIGGLGDFDNMCAAMDQIDGEIYGTLSIAGLQSTNLFYDWFSQQLRDRAFLSIARSGDTQPVGGSGGQRQIGSIFRGQNPCCPQWTGGIFGHGTAGNASSDGNASGFNYTGGGSTIVLARPHGDTTFGFFMDYENSHVDLKRMDQYATVENYRLGGFLNHNDCRSYYSLIGHIGCDQYDVVRNMAIGVNRTARSQYNGWQASMYGERGFTYRLVRNLYAEPFGALQYTHLRQNSLSESGASAINLNSSGQTLDSLRTRLGLRLRLPRTRIGDLSFRTIWTHELLDQSTGLVNLNFTDAGASFAVRGVDLGRDWVTLSPGIQHKFGRANLYANYLLTFNDRQAFHTGTAGLLVKW